VEDGLTNLEALIEEELSEQDPHQEAMSHDRYGLEIDERYLVDEGLLEVQDAVERCSDWTLEMEPSYHSEAGRSKSEDFGPGIRELPRDQDEQIIYHEPGVEAPEKQLVIIIQSQKEW
jgi:hypothetical protein